MSENGDKCRKRRCKLQLLWYSLLQKTAVNFYRDLFTSNGTQLGGCATASSFPRLSEEDRELLSAVVSVQDIKEAVFDMGAFKAPGPDGLQAFFYQDYWDILRDSLCNLVKEIFEEPSRIHGLNETNVVLIPKFDDSSTMKDFRPISLCNVSYTIVTKIISNRLRRILPKLIGNHQSSFIPGRQTSDNVIITQEIIHESQERTRGMARCQS